MDDFRITEANGIATLTLTRPQQSNALTLDFWRDFPTAIQQLDATGATRALIIVGEGRNFCAGMDLSVFTAGSTMKPDHAAGRAHFYETARLMQDALARLEHARFPVIAAIQGACVGAGLSDSYLKIAEIDIAMMADLGALQRLPKLLPDAVVKQMAYTGYALPALRAEALGFINATEADAAGALQLAHEAAKAIAARAPLAIAGSKDSLLYARDHSVAQSLERAGWMQAAIWNTEDITAAITARATKSAPHFKNLLPRAKI
ncbi:MAG: enoyl-CoA hydratase [Acidiphilium sp. 34-60-192]|nr:MAG: enoyl-CoA hydratase [Acidiphilium sp. 34-60-192]